MFPYDAWFVLLVMTMSCFASFRAIQASLLEDVGRMDQEEGEALPRMDDPVSVVDHDTDLQQALALSRLHEADEERRRKEEEEILQEILRLSVTDK